MAIAKRCLATLAAIIGLGAPATAGAREFSVTSQTWRTVFLELRIEGVFGNINCEVELEGSLHTRRIPKVVQGLIGTVTAARINSCFSNTATILRETLPWNMTYLIFGGTLPNIATIRGDIIGFSMQVREPAFTCLFRSLVGAPVKYNFNRETVTRALTSSLLSGSISSTCGALATVSTSFGTLTTLNSTSRITLTLI